MAPDSGFNAPVISAKSVLLPAPFCPMSALLEPPRNEKETSFTIGRLWPYSNDTSSNRTITSSRGIASPYFILNKKETRILCGLFYFFFAPLEATAFLAGFFFGGLPALLGASRLKISLSLALIASKGSLDASACLAPLLAFVRKSTCLRSPVAAPLSKHSFQYVFRPSLGINGTSHFLPQLSHIAEYIRLSSE